MVKVEEDPEEIFAWLKKEKIEVAFVSFDVDGMDPLDIPSTGTTAPNGLRTEKTCQFFKRMRDTFNQLNIEWSIEVV